MSKPDYHAEKFILTQEANEIQRWRNYHETEKNIILCAVHITIDIMALTMYSLWHIKPMYVCVFVNFLGVYLMYVGIPKRIFL